MSTERIYKWDNVKGLLILFVVLGHFASYLMDDDAMIRTFYMFIYIFHMPLFVFITGMFSARSIETGVGLRRKVAGFLFLTLFIKFALFTVRYCMHNVDELSIGGKWGIEWYVFVMAIFMVLTWLLREMNRIGLIVIAVVIALFIGYDPEIGKIWSVSRIFVFYPYFLAGTLWDRTRTGFKHWGLDWLARIAGLAILAGAVWMVWTHLDFVSGLEDLLLGYRPYVKILKDPAWGWVYRLALYGIAVVLSICVVFIMPGCKTPFAILGERSLPIYVFHRPILYYLHISGYRKYLMGVQPEHWRACYMLTGAAVTLILALPLFDIPFRIFWKQLKKM